MMSIKWKPPALLALFAVLLLTVPGCVLQDQNGNPIETVSGGDMTVPKYLNDSELICQGIPGNKPCYCMACSNKTSYGFLGLGWLVGYYDSNLQGGNCSISKCNETDYEEIVESDNSTQMRVFGLGAGQSFVSTGHANLYCNYTLQLATKWMKGTKNSPPRVPQVSRAACWLQRSTLPLYIYYTEGKAIDPSRTQEIASAFQAADIGPVFVTTEVWLNSSDDNAISNVKQQLYNIRHFCTKCMTVLAVKPNDYNALYKVIGVPPDGIDTTMLDSIDAAGFGFRANDYPHCDADRIIYENLNFSRYILKNYNKPTIWLYAGASEGNNSDGSCQWDGTMVSGFYQELLTRTGGLASSGVLGMGFYEFVDGSGSLPCNGVQGCSFGMLSANGSQKHPQMNAWADMCQEVGANSEYRNPLIFSRNGQGSSCEVMTNDQPSLHAATMINSGQGFSSDEVVPEAKIAKLGCGEACPAETSMPYVYYSGTAGGFDGNHCEPYPIIDERADDADISTTYMRAEFEQESGFDPYAVSTCVDDDYSACNPEKYTMAQICELAGMADDPKCQKDKCTGINPQNGKKQKPCAYGLAQCIEYPGKAYTIDNPYGQVSGGVPAPVANCGGENYNPFDASQSACCGVNKFADVLRGGSGSTENWVNSNWAQLSKCTGGMKPEEKGWAEYYLASNRYFGLKPATLNEFVKQRDANGECCAGSDGSQNTQCYQNYIAYLRSLSPKNSYGAQVMSRYRAAVSACDSDCPK